MPVKSHDSPVQDIRWVIANQLALVRDVLNTDDDFSLSLMQSLFDRGGTTATRDQDIVESSARP